MSVGRKPLVSEIVHDSSVIVAIARSEPVHAGVIDLIQGAVMSTVNYSEVLSKFMDIGLTERPYADQLLSLLSRIVPFTSSQARLAAEIRKSTRHVGLSFGDRACIALALELGAEVYTADRAWAKIDVGCKIHLIR